METVKNQVTDFLNKCEEIKRCKFIMATSRIKDLLKSIVNSSELYELFNTVASNFDYVAAKQKCFQEEGGVYGKCRVVLPDTVGERLAFIFCLLVEFDRNDINFNAFLQKFYPKDGSYYSSYHLFCDEVINSLESIICDIYANELAEPDVIPQQGQTATAIPGDTSSAMSVVCMLVESERNSVAESALSDEDKEAADSMLVSLYNAVMTGDANLVKSLSCGYNYFAMQNNYSSESLNELFNAVGELMNIL